MDTSSRQMDTDQSESDLQGTIETATTAIDQLSEGKMVSSGDEVVHSPQGDNDSAVPEEPSPPPQANISKKPLVSSVLVQLEQLIVSDEWTQLPKTTQLVAPQKRKKVALPRLNELGRSVVTSYSLKSYIDLLGAQHRQSIASWLYGNTTNVFTNLFRFPNGTVYFHDDPLKGGILHVAKLALRQLYPNYNELGYKVFNARPPMVYVSPLLHYDIHAVLAQELGLADVVVLPSTESAVSHVEGKIDLVALEERLALDEEAGRQPLMIVAVMGSAIFGQNDSLSKLRELRERYHFWLHVTGQGISALALKAPAENVVRILQSMDSMTVPLGVWAGIHAVSTITLHRPVESLKVNYRDKLDSLPWWVATQHQNASKITDTIEHAYQLSRSLTRGLLKLPQIQLIGFGKQDLNKLIERIERGSPSLAPTSVVFKYRCAMDEVDDDASLKSDESTIEREYMDCLNSWLGQGLMTECPLMGLHLVECSGEWGTAIRCCSLESAAMCNTQNAHVPQMLKQLEDTLCIVDATVRARRQMHRIVDDYPTLLVVNVQKWAGVGAVSYIPSIVRDTPPGQWNDKQLQQITHLNIELVHALRSSDSAFSVGDSDEKIGCVKFGMLADENDLNDLITMVARRGKEIEESSQYLESLAEMVRQGIEAANQDLRKENEERLVNEGVLRQVPLVGSLLNWMSPISKDTSNIKGRSFDLKTGQVLATDAIYKHKLQLKMEGHAGDENVLTPTSPITTSLTPHNISTNQDTPVTEETAKE